MWDRSSVGSSIALKMQVSEVRLLPIPQTKEKELNMWIALGVFLWGAGVALTAPLLIEHKKAWAIDVVDCWLLSAVLWPFVLVYLAGESYRQSSKMKRLAKEVKLKEKELEMKKVLKELKDL